MIENILSYLKTNINFLTNSEKKIAKLIIENPKRFITLSMSELSKESEVSQGSIINFSKKFANGGYPELKLIIAANAGSEEPENFDIADVADSMTDILSKNIRSQEIAYSLTKEANKEEVLKHAAEKIMNAEKVEIYGIYRSASVATDFCYQLLEMGIPAAFVSDILTCSISAAMLNEKDVVIAVSSSGKTRDILEAVQNAKSKNVPVIAITSNINSPLAKIADDVLIASSSGNSLGGYGSEIRASQLILTDMICSYIRSNIKSNERKQYFELKTILNSRSVEEWGND